MDDFAPEIRNSALWSGDSRKIAQGNAAQVFLEKTGRAEIQQPDDEELLAMGHAIEPVIARIFEDRHDCNLKRLDAALTHPKHEWLRSHVDYAEAYGGRGSEFLVECKNYNANYISYFSAPDEPLKIPDADMAQCLHEAIVSGVDTVWLAVLFGGQRYREYELTFTTEDKEKWIKRLAELWGQIQAGNPPPPTTPEQARELWPTDDSQTIIANKNVEMFCERLARMKEQHKRNEEEIDRMQAEVMAYMGTRSVLQAVDGKTLATWKTSKGSKRFDAKLFQQSQPMIYDSFCVEQPGSRRFLIKS